MLTDLQPRGRSNSTAVVALAFLGFCACVIPLLHQGVFQGGVLRAMSVMVPAIAVGAIRLTHGGHLNPPAVFIALTSLFAFGQFWRDFLSLPIPTAEGYWDVSQMFSSPEIDRGGAVALIVVCAVAAGAVLARMLVPEGRPRTVRRAETQDGSAIWLVAALALMVPVLLGDIERSVNVAALGYGDGYRINSPLLYAANGVFPMVVIGVLVTWRDRRKQAGVVLACALLRDLFVIIAVQNRGQSVSEVIIYLLIWKRYYGFGRYAKWFAGAAVVGAVLLLPYVSFSRSDVVERTLGEFLIQNNALSIFLTEFGGSLSSVIYAAQYVSTGGDTMGASYFVVILGTALPILGSALTEMVGAPLTGETMNSYFGRTGLGGSFVADLLMNFGGMAFVVAVSLLMGVGLSLLARSLAKPIEGRTFSALWSWFLFLGSIIVVRGYLTELATVAKVGAAILLAVLTATRLLETQLRRRNFLGHSSKTAPAARNARDSRSMS